MIACTNNHKTKGIDRKEEATNLLTAALLASQTQSIAPMILLFPLPFPDRKLRRTISFFMISYCALVGNRGGKLSISMAISLFKK
jgi:hypothetical protein